MNTSADTTSRVRFITGASRGRGRAFDTARTRMDTRAAWEQVSRAAEQAIPAPVGAAGC
ncbi:hypothetical protein ACFZDG_12930 [Kitasatospora xanthocidica]|uniref:hypothetical protein n=1 Tax=Kitasatospora xanthocidica TaxID=83382 RepID=UPI0036EC9661